MSLHQPTSDWPEEFASRQERPSLVPAIVEKLRSILNVDILSDGAWDQLHTDYEEYQRKNDAEKQKYILSLMQTVFPDTVTLNMQALVETALLFARDRQNFMKKNVQHLFEDASGEKAGIGKAQLQNLLRQMNVLEANCDIPKVRYQLHLILDLVTECLELIDIDAFEKAAKENYVQPLGLFRKTMACFSAEKIHTSSNYLLSRKYQDIYELLHAETLNKPDALHGVHGAQSDKSIYTYKHALENYRLRTAFDYYDGYPNRNPIFPVAPGYLAEYADGQIKRIFQAPHIVTGVLEEKMIQQNDPDLAADIYRKLNTPIEELHNGKYKDHHPLTRGVNKLEDIWNFSNQLQNGGKEFVYDMSRIDTKNLHPIVIGDLVTRNNEVLKRHWQPKNSQLVPMSEEEFQQKIFPGGRPAEEEIYNWKMLSSLSIRKKVEEDFGIDIAEYEPWIMRLFLEFLERVEVEQIPVIKKFIASGVKKDRIIALTAKTDDHSHEIDVITMANRPDVDTMYAEYAQLVSRAEQLTTSILAVDPSLDFSSVFSGLVRRGSQLLEDAQKVLDDPKGIASILADIRRETGIQSVSRSFFLSMSNLLENGRNISLKDYDKQQSFIVNHFERVGLGNVLLKALQSKKKLEPIPEIHWRVDRTSKEYERRFGLNVSQFLSAFVEKDRKQILLELGPGNGTFKHERGPLASAYLDVALCDKLYYPLAPLIEKAIDFDKLEKDIGMPLPPHERRLLCDFLYKILVIEEGQAASDHFAYDKQVQDDCARDPSKIVEHLHRKAPLLATTSVVPDTISSRDDKGNVVYRSKIQKLSTPSFTKAYDCISRNPATYISTNTDVYSMIPAYPAGTMVGDFGMLKNLKNKQLDAVIGVRSTVYVRGEDYVNLIVTIADKLTENGVWIDDSIRDNDGWYYRLHEAREAQKSLRYPIYIITGPGFPTEDFRQDTVPMALVVTQSRQKLDYIRANLQAEYTLQTLDQLTSDEAYLRTLDATGHVLQTLTQTAA